MIDQLSVLLTQNHINKPFFKEISNIWLPTFHFYELQIQRYEFHLRNSLQLTKTPGGVMLSAKHPIPRWDEAGMYFDNFR